MPMQHIRATGWVDPKGAGRPHGSTRMYKRLPNIASMRARGPAFSSVEKFYFHRMTIAVIRVTLRRDLTSSRCLIFAITMQRSGHARNWTLPTAMIPVVYDMTTVLRTGSVGLIPGPEFRNRCSNRISIDSRTMRQTGSGPYRLPGSETGSPRGRILSFTSSLLASSSRKYFTLCSRLNPTQKKLPRRREQGENGKEHDFGSPYCSERLMRWFCRCSP
jgi:hypothetical protein